MGNHLQLWSCDFNYCPILLLFYLYGYKRGLCNWFICPLQVVSVCNNFVHPTKVAQGINNGQILMLKVSKKPYWLIWNERIFERFSSTALLAKYGIKDYSIFQLLGATGLNSELKPITPKSFVWTFFGTLAAILDCCYLGVGPQSWPLLIVIFIFSHGLVI